MSTTKISQASEPKSVRSRPSLFRALGKKEPPAEIQINGETYTLLRVLKHDSWAVTSLYQRGEKVIVCKFHRQQSICFLPMKWLGRLLARREHYMFAALADVPNVPDSTGEVYVDGKLARHASAHDFVPGHPLGKEERVKDEFFEELENVLAEMHKRKLAYVDLHKRENIIVGDDGRPYLIDFQISFGLPKWWPGSGPIMQGILRLLQKSDNYHLRKHYARCRPDLAGYDLKDVAAKRPWWIRIHRWIAVPFRKLRRRLLVLVGIRSGKGRVESETFAEEAVRVEIEARKAA